MFILDRTILPLIIGPFVSYLILNGHINQACESDVNAALTEAFVVILTLGSLAISMLHHTKIKQIEASTPENEDATRRMQLMAIVAKLVTAAKAFYLKPPKTPEP